MSKRIYRGVELEDISTVSSDSIAFSILPPGKHGGVESCSIQIGRRGEGLDESQVLEERASELPYVSLRGMVLEIEVVIGGDKVRCGD